jgi:hypothetical protein
VHFYNVFSKSRTSHIASNVHKEPICKQRLLYSGKAHILGFAAIKQDAVDSFTAVSSEVEGRTRGNMLTHPGVVHAAIQSDSWKVENDCNHQSAKGILHGHLLIRFGSGVFTYHRWSRSSFL